MQLHEMLSKLAREFVFERAKPFANSEFGNFVRKEIAEEARKNLIFLPYDLHVKSSVGNGNWASVPWLGLFDPLITKSATKGFYVVYLINPQTEEIILSMNQGTTALYREFGESRGRDVLRRRATDMSERVASYSNIFDRSAITLGSQESLPAGYEAGHAFGRTYQARSLDQKLFYDDFEKMLSAYEALIDLGGTSSIEDFTAEAGTSDIEETRRYVLSRRIERAPNVREPVLAKKKSVCEGCGLDPAIHLSYRGPAINVPLDIHHAKPISGMAEGESRRYRIPDDFMVLCPTCHRLIHKQDDPSNLDKLKSQIAFKHASLV